MSSTASGSTKPPAVTPITSSFVEPQSASQRAVRPTEACSTADTNIRLRSSGAASTAPRRARLLASVAPAVNTTPPGRPPTSAATCSRASSTAAACRRPNRCTEEALPTSNPTAPAPSPRTPWDRAVPRRCSRGRPPSRLLRCTCWTSQRYGTEHVVVRLHRPSTPPASIIGPTLLCRPKRDAEGPDVLLAANFDGFRISLLYW